MLPLPDGRAFLRWMFWSLGFLLLLGHEFVVHSILRADHWAAVFFPGNPAYFMSAAYFYLIPTPLLCLATASGLKRRKPWARWTGAAASALLLLGFPILTIAGVLGLYALLAKTARSSAARQPAPPPKPTTDFWASQRTSSAQPFISGLTMFLGFQALALLTLYAQHNGLPPWNPGYAWWGYLFLFLFLQTALHELGHAGMAWSVYHRVRVIGIGPLTFWNDGNTRQFRFEWKRIFDSGGYMGAVPASDENLFEKEVAITAAGPVMSLTIGGLLLLAFFCLPGTSWQSHWWIVAFNAVLGLCYAVMSLIPWGYSDGAMLYHLLRDTPAGRQLLDGYRVSLVQEQAQAAHLRADFEKEVELRQSALETALQGGERNSMAIAQCHQSLGHARRMMQDWTGAAAQFRKCLEFEAECALSPSLLVNSWSGLQEASVERHSAGEAERAGAAAIAAIRSRQAKLNRAGLAVSRCMLAQLHLRAGAYDAAIAEAAAVLADLPCDSHRLLLRGAILSVQALAYLHLDASEHGLDRARDAASSLGSPEIPESSRNLASHHLAELGDALCKAGQSGFAVDLLRQAVARLESNGAVTAAAQSRIRLARALRALGRYAEAEYMLPEDDTLPPVLRRALLAERAEIHLALGRSAAAVTDGRALLALWQSEPAPPALEVAIAEAQLARACLDARDPAQAASLALRAAQVLLSSGHPDAADCRITLALATRQRSLAVFDDALRLIQSAPLLSPAEKNRRLEVERARIDSRGPTEGSAVWEPAATTNGAQTTLSQGAALALRGQTALSLVCRPVS